MKVMLIKPLPENQYQENEEFNNLYSIGQMFKVSKNTRDTLEYLIITPKVARTMLEILPEEKQCFIEVPDESNVD